jgi:hypothetical protein
MQTYIGIDGKSQILLIKINYLFKFDILCDCPVVLQFSLDLLGNFDKNVSLCPVLWVTKRELFDGRYKRNRKEIGL